ncbi:phage portal protein [Bradyrhizobium elkanii]|uniref:phage portal protein n=1 Tax=Bradyrhizobium elkanii TaxID=29448 RepID=UPI00272CF0EC|nr:phage portal protein [Bradyrhizobium elkanii]WLA80298.1 phage portal protein [Bradyrhizobium elkanii]
MPSVPTVRQGSSKSKNGLTLRIFGRDITITKSAVGPTDISPLVSDRGWFNIIREPFTGAWQRNQERRSETVIAHSAVYSAVTLIASDVSKMCIRLVEEDDNGIWEEVTVSAFSPVLRKPNRYQNRIKFIEQWIVSKLLHGNAYILKQRDLRGIVTAMYVLDPCRVRPLVAPDGSVYYQLSKDNLSGIEDAITVPAEEIIHDTMVPLYHPLCGVSPLYACGIAAMQGLSIQDNTTRLFQNSAVPSGILTAPDTIDEVTATRLKQHWEANYSGQNYGRVAVLGDGLKYEKMAMTAAESQLIEQLKWTAETVCSCFHVPPYMIGVGAAPKYDNIEALNQQYYSQCLQSLIEQIELCLDEGLGLTDVPGHTYGTEFDLDDLLRMDTATQYKTIGEGIGSGLLAPNEGRKKVGQKPVKGGDTPYLQQQNFSLAALDRRDQSDDPFALSSKRDQNTPSQAQQDAAAAAVDAPPPPAPAKSFDDEIEIAAQHQIANWALQEALADQLTKMAA